MIQDMESREEESMKEEQRHNLMSAERKYKKQKKENAILRNIYSSIVLATRIDWSRKDRVRELMLCNEDEPGVPENELFPVCYLHSSAIQARIWKTTGESKCSSIMNEGDHFVVHPYATSHSIRVHFVSVVRIGVISLRHRVMLLFLLSLTRTFVAVIATASNLF